MGIEDQPTVEEPTEPPICGSTNASNNSLQSQDPRSGTVTPSPDEKSKAPFPASEWLPRAHITSAQELARGLETDVENGLDATEAARRLERDGPNKVEGAKGLSVWKIFMRQISNSLTIVLLITMVLSFAIDDYIEGGVICAVIVLNIVVG